MPAPVVKLNEIDISGGPYETTPSQLFLLRPLEFGKWNLSWQERSCKNSRSEGDKCNEITAVLAIFLDNIILNCNRTDKLNRLIPNTANNLTLDTDDGEY